MKMGEVTTTTPVHGSNNNTHNVNSQRHVIKLLHNEIFSYKKAFVAKKLADEAVRNHTMIVHAVRKHKATGLQS